MLERHGFFQTHHEGGTQDGIGKSPAHRWQVEL